MLSPRGSSSTVKIQTSICLQLQDCLLEGLDHLLKLWNWSQRCFGQKRKSCNFVRPLVFFWRREKTPWNILPVYLGFAWQWWFWILDVHTCSARITMAWHFYRGYTKDSHGTLKLRGTWWRFLTWNPPQDTQEEPQLLLKGAKLNAGPDLQMGTAWWSNPQTSASDPRKDLFSVSICVQWQYILIYFVVSLTPFFHLSCFWEATHITCWPACINVMMIHVHDLKTIAAWFPWHLCGHRICWWQMA